MVLESQCFLDASLINVLDLGFFKTRNNTLQKVNNTVWNEISFRLEDDDKHPVEFNDKTMAFTFVDKTYLIK